MVIIMLYYQFLIIVLLQCSINFNICITLVVLVLQSVVALVLQHCTSSIYFISILLVLLEY